ncbi:hypothetical protein DFH09DRAFT_1086910 [Mycena vulgaris]|nr:hypothetical protein DFH09DRAFT_1086910 [Mycena vulgaris]
MNHPFAFESFEYLSLRHTLRGIHADTFTRNVTSWGRGCAASTPVQATLQHPLLNATVCSAKGSANRGYSNNLSSPAHGFTGAITSTRGTDTPTSRTGHALTDSRNGGAQNAGIWGIAYCSSRLSPATHMNCCGTTRMRGRGRGGAAGEHGVAGTRWIEDLRVMGQIPPRDQWRTQNARIPHLRLERREEETDHGLRRRGAVPHEEMSSTVLEGEVQNLGVPRAGWGLKGEQFGPLRERRITTDQHRDRLRTQEANARGRRGCRCWSGQYRCPGWRRGRSSDANAYEREDEGRESCWTARTYGEGYAQSRGTLLGGAVMTALTNVCFEWRGGGKNSEHTSTPRERAEDEAGEGHGEKWDLEFEDSRGRSGGCSRAPRESPWENLSPRSGADTAEARRDEADPWRLGLIPLAIIGVLSNEGYRLHAGSAGLNTGKGRQDRKRPTKRKYGGHDRKKDRDGVTTAWNRARPDVTATWSAAPEWGCTTDESPALDHGRGIQTLALHAPNESTRTREKRAKKRNARHRARPQRGTVHRVVDYGVDTTKALARTATNSRDLSSLGQRPACAPSHPIAPRASRMGERRLPLCLLCRSLARSRRRGASIHGLFGHISIVMAKSGTAGAE